MTTPFLLNKDEKILTESEKIDFYVEETHNAHSGKIFLTNERLVILEHHLLKSKIFVVVPLESLTIIEHFDMGVWKAKRSGMRMSFLDPMGTTVELRCYLSNRRKSKDWRDKWVDSIQKTHEIRVKELSNGVIPVTVVKTPAELLKELKELLDGRIITLEEFEAKKKELLTQI